MTIYYDKYKPELNDLGSEVLNPIPLAENCPFTVAQESTDDRILRLIRSTQLAQAAEQHGFETEEEANDFDIPEEDPFPITPYQMEAALAESNFLEETPESYAQEDENASEANLDRNQDIPETPSGDIPDQEPAQSQNAEKNSPQGGTTSPDPV